MSASSKKARRERNRRDAENWLAAHPREEMSEAEAEKHAGPASGKYSTDPLYVKNQAELEEFRLSGIALLERVVKKTAEIESVPPITDTDRRTNYNNGLIEIFKGAKGSIPYSPEIKGVYTTKFMVGANLVFNANYGAQMPCIDPDMTNSTPERSFLTIDPRYPDTAIILSFDMARLITLSDIIRDESRTQQNLRAPKRTKILSCSYFDGGQKDAGVLIIENLNKLNPEKTAAGYKDTVYGAILTNIFTAMDAIKTGTVKDLPEMLKHAGLDVPDAPASAVGPREMPLAKPSQLKL